MKKLSICCFFFFISSIDCYSNFFVTISPENFSCILKCLSESSKDVIHKFDQLAMKYYPPKVAKGYAECAAKYHVPLYDEVWPYYVKKPCLVDKIIDCVLNMDVHLCYKDKQKFAFLETELQKMYYNDGIYLNCDKLPDTSASPPKGKGCPIPLPQSPAPTPQQPAQRPQPQAPRPQAQAFASAVSHAGGRTTFSKSENVHTVTTTDPSGQKHITTVDTTKTDDGSNRPIISVATTEAASATAADNTGTSTAFAEATNTKTTDASGNLIGDTYDSDAYATATPGARGRAVADAHLGKAGASAQSSG